MHRCGAGPGSDDRAPGHPALQRAHLRPRAGAADPRADPVANNAGMTTVRTTNVSRIPRPTMGQDDQRRSTPKTQNTAARTTPRTGDHCTRCRYGADDPQSGAVFGCLFPGASDQEDRVVHPQRHQEQEGEQGVVMSSAGKPSACARSICRPDPAQPLPTAPSRRPGSAVRCRRATSRTYSAARTTARMAGISTSRSRIAAVFASGLGRPEPPTNRGVGLVHRSRRAATVSNDF